MNICKRCGDCCSKIPCGIGFVIFGDQRPCPALENENGVFSCGLVINASKYIDLGVHSIWKNIWFGKMVSGMIGISLGCCTTKEGERLAIDLKTRIKKPFINIFRDY